MWKPLTSATAFSTVVFSVSAAKALDVKSVDSIKQWSKGLAESIVNDYYKTRPTSLNVIFYNLPKGQNDSAQIDWGESASIWDALIGYSHLTGDHQFDDIIAEALYAQMGPKQDFIPQGMGKLPNDEQAQWALAALSAAEYGVPRPVDGNPTFLELAKNVLSSQVERWNTTSCKGGLRVFVNDRDSEHFSKNAHSASNFFLLGARLNKLTGTKVYAQWAERQFFWAQESGLIGKDFEVYDIMHSKCDVEQDVSTNLNLGRWMEGCAVMFTNNKGQYDPAPWNDRLKSLLDTTKTNPDLYRMPSKPETAPYDLIASSDHSIANTLQYARSLSHTVFWVNSAGSTLSPNITAATIAATQVCSPTTPPTNSKDALVNLTCLADWRPPGPARIGEANDKSVLAAAAALEAVQGLLWSMSRARTKETKKPEHSQPTANPQNPNPAPNSQKPEPVATSGSPDLITKSLPQSTQPATEHTQATQLSTISGALPFPTTSGSPTSSTEAGSSVSRSRTGWFVGVSAVVCVVLIV